MQIKSLKFLLIAFMLSLSACSLLQSEPPDETRNWSAQKLYAEAREELNAGGYERSIKYFEKLESRYPFGTYAQQAQMDIAYAHYRAGDQALGLAAVERFIKLHPNHPNVDYMYYLRGLINFNDKLSLFDFVSRQDLTERDPKAAREAFDSFKLLVDRYPSSVYAPDARARMAYLVNAMAQYDVHVADYYYRRGAYLAAANRAQQVIREFKDSPAVEDALYIMARSYDALGMPELRDDANRVFRQNFPNSELPMTGGVRKTKSPWWKIW